MTESGRRVAATLRGNDAGRPTSPALEAWRAEIRAGLRTRYVFDPLWRAACEDMHALEAVRADLTGIVASCQRKAREIIRRAAREAVS